MRVDGLCSPRLVVAKIQSTCSRRDREKVRLRKSFNFLYFSLGFARWITWVTLAEVSMSKDARTYQYSVSSCDMERIANCALALANQASGSLT